jgi:DNA gyrase subunit A
MDLVDPGQKVIAMLVAEGDQQSVLTATENGYGKRTQVVRISRAFTEAHKGVIAIQQSERNGKVVSAVLVQER